MLAWVGGKIANVEWPWVALGQAWVINWWQQAHEVHGEPYSTNWPPYGAWRPLKHTTGGASNGTQDSVRQLQVISKATTFFLAWW